jgi:hypothetical protein
MKAENKLFKEEQHNLYSLLNIIQVFKPRRLERAEHTTRMTNVQKIRDKKCTENCR